MEENKLIEYPMEQFINDFTEMFSDPDNYGVTVSQSFTNESYFDMWVDISQSFVYDDRIELQGEGFSSVALSFKDFKVIKQNGDFRKSYYILFDKRKNNITDYDLIINVFNINE